MTTLYLFAHQDDEIGVFADLAAARARGDRIVCVFMTDGAWERVSAERRNAESVTVLTQFGLASGDIAFLGSKLAIADGRLIENMDRAIRGLREFARTLGNVDRIVMHAYEGGHQDHDATFILGVTLATELGIVATSRQFPLYRSPAGRLFPTFAQPLPANGQTERRAIPPRERLWYLTLLRHYRSQWQVMARLMPLLIWDYLTEGCQKLQPVSAVRVRERPNAGAMLYEGWDLYDYPRFRRHADAFVGIYLAPQEMPERAVMQPKMVHRND